MNSQTSIMPSPTRIPLIILILGIGSLITVLVYRFYDHEEFAFRLVFGLALPAMPYVVLAILGMIRRNQDYLLTPAHLVGAGLGALLTTIIPWTILWYFATFQNDRGVAIGAGILVMLSFLAIPFVMLLGGFTGQIVSRRFQANHVRSS